MKKKGLCMCVSIIAAGLMCCDQNFKPPITTNIGTRKFEKIKILIIADIRRWRNFMENRSIDLQINLPHYNCYTLSYLKITTKFPLTSLILLMMLFWKMI